jgi:hypothetical protein
MIDFGKGIQKSLRALRGFLFYVSPYILCKFLGLSSPTLDTIFSIGAYYTSFPRCENDNLKAHLHYFGQAMSLSNHMMTDCTLDNIQMLLAQCFFLLAMGQTDR